MHKLRGLTVCEWAIALAVGLLAMLAVAGGFALLSICQHSIGE
jgi:hypothetical protein